MLVAFGNEGCFYIKKYLNFDPHIYIYDSQDLFLPRFGCNDLPSRGSSESR
jgi:hypothetical protein